MISFKNFSSYLFLSIFKFISLGLGHLRATNLNLVEKQQVMRSYGGSVSDGGEEATGSI